MACILAWTFTARPEKYILTIPILLGIHILTGISTSGITLASGNIGLKLAPKGHATAYLASIGLISSIAAGIAPIIGGLFADFFAERQLSFTLEWKSPVRELVFQTLDFRHWDFFFLFAFLIGFYSLHRLAMVKEIGEVEERIVINELIYEVRRDMRTLSTVSGLRNTIQFPFSIIRNSLKSLIITNTFKNSSIMKNSKRLVK